MILVLPCTVAQYSIVYHIKCCKLYAAALPCYIIIIHIDIIPVMLYSYVYLAIIVAI